MAKTESLFKGEFLVDPKTFRRRLKDIKAFVFDWDGVFNDGHKTESGSSSFSEIDSLGTNLLRFSHYMMHGALPFTAIISGEHNKAAAAFAQREHFHAFYPGIKNKIEALQHFCKTSGITAAETAFVFDDLLDLSAAAVCGLRIMVTRPANPLFTRYVRKETLADYFTFSGGSSNAVREAAELIMHFHGSYDTIAGHRVSYTKEYKTYLELRNSVKTKQVTAKDLAILSSS
jgi:3-deoxy-D-manno-octulosonate 8-phosphate phosphatase (KDO 8-P phosphatase)